MVWRGVGWFALMSVAVGGFWLLWIWWFGWDCGCFGLFSIRFLCVGLLRILWVGGLFVLISLSSGV